MIDGRTFEENILDLVFASKQFDCSTFPKWYHSPLSLSLFNTSLLDSWWARRQNWCLNLNLNPNWSRVKDWTIYNTTWGFCKINKKFLSTHISVYRVTLERNGTIPTDNKDPLVSFQAPLVSPLNARGPLFWGRPSLRVLLIGMNK